MRAALAVLLLAIAPGLAVAQQLPMVRLFTEAGIIDVEIDSVHAPATAANFLRLVDDGAYADGKFHRTVTPTNQPQSPVKIEVIQGGPKAGWKDGAPLALERTSVTGLRHVDGAISMARGGPDTATSDFFICIGAQPELDFGGKRNPDGQGFAAFGHVTRGMDIVRTIQQKPVVEQKLTPPVRIIRIERVGR
jgi:peptidyl-prolyl cis-trans isomerase A (cyclophilin A)